VLTCWAAPPTPESRPLHQNNSNIIIINHKGFLFHYPSQLLARTVPRKSLHHRNHRQLLACAKTRPSPSTVSTPQKKPSPLFLPLFLPFPIFTLL
jgi:hypothetical protein